MLTLPIKKEWFDMIVSYENERFYRKKVNENESNK